MPRFLTAREQAEMLAPWRRVAAPPLATPPGAPADLAAPAAPVDLSNPPPPTLTNVPRDQFDKILAPKGVSYDQHLDSLESHFDAATESQQRKGRVWYRAGGDTLRDIGKKFGFSTNRMIAVAAALSGRTDWNDNLHFTAHMAGNYRPGENEDEWQRAAIHPSALARYMEDRHGIVPGEKKKDDLTNPAHFSIKELKGLHKDGFMPRTRKDFEVLANAHGGNHWQYNSQEIEPKTGKKGRWTNAPLRGFEELQTPEGKKAWIDNAEMSMRGNIESAPNRWQPKPRRKKGEPEPDPGVRQRFEDVIDAHMRQVNESTSPYGYKPGGAYAGAGVPTLSSNVDKAKLLMQVGEHEFDAQLKGPKYRAFFSNLGNKLRFRQSDRREDQGYYDLGGKHWTELDPELLRSTVDTQHMRASSHPHGSLDIMPGYDDSSVATPAQYEVYQQGLIDLTHRINSKRPQHQHLLPHQVQAVIWGKFKDDLNALKKGKGGRFRTPTMDGISPFGDRYSSLRFASHVDPRLLEHPHCNPYETDSQDWWDAVLDSWTSNHQHELSGPGGGLDPLLSSVQDVLNYSAAIEKMSIPENVDEDWEGRVWNHIMRHPDGATFRDEPGDGPTDGYMVSLPGTEEKIPFYMLMPEDVGDFARDNADEINRPGNGMGTWSSPVPGGESEAPHLYMDVSHNHDDSWEAAQAATEGDQIGIYDLTHPDYNPKDRTRYVDTPQFVHDQIAKGGSRTHGQRY